jgi:hypothetical protein
MLLFGLSWTAAFFGRKILGGLKILEMHEMDEMK